jgi:predicted TPR repeat methyltransferase
MDSTFDQARTFFLEGVEHYEAGRLREAERTFSAALALMPGRPSVLTNLGAVRLKLGRTEEAMGLLQEALAQEPDNAEALGHCGTACAELGRLEEALALFDRALAQNGKLPTVWMMRGSVLKELGRRDDAQASFEVAIQRGGDVELNRYYLAGLAAGEPPRHPPRHYVQALFDGYAERFDEHLEVLRYDAPRLLLRRVAAAGRSYRHALDLGCGTGLCGPLLRPLAIRVTGVDLSANMLDKARALGVYDELQQADAAEFLAASPHGFDLVVAADVFIYVGVLDEVFRQLARVVPPQGTFCFTVEEAPDTNDVLLRPSLRYAHSEAYVRRMAKEHGFTVTAIERAPVREDQRAPIAGLFVWLERA